MARKATTFSKVSTGYKDSSTTIGEANYDMQAIDFAATTVTATTVTGTTGAFTGGAAIGGGENIVAVSTATAAVSLGAINPLESSSVQTVGLSGATRGDSIILNVDSIYADAAGNTDVTWMCSSTSTTGEVDVWGVNSTLTAVTPTAATVIRVTRLNFADYL